MQLATNSRRGFMHGSPERTLRHRTSRGLENPIELFLDNRVAVTLPGQSAPPPGTCRIDDRRPSRSARSSRVSIPATVGRADDRVRAGCVQTLCWAAGCNVVAAPSVPYSPLARGGRRILGDDPGRVIIGRDPWCLEFSTWLMSGQVGAGGAAFIPAYLLPVSRGTRRPLLSDNWFGATRGGPAVNPLI
jgi:hypothetical protein